MLNLTFYFFRIYIDGYVDMGILLFLDLSTGFEKIPELNITSETDMAQRGLG